MKHGPSVGYVGDFCGRPRLIGRSRYGSDNALERLLYAPFVYTVSRRRTSNMQFRITHTWSSMQTVRSRTNSTQESVAHFVTPVVKKSLIPLLKRNAYNQQYALGRAANAPRVSQNHQSSFPNDHAASSPNIPHSSSSVQTHAHFSMFHPSRALHSSFFQSTMSIAVR